MAYKQLVNFWPLVPAVDIQAIYENIKSNNMKSVDSDIKQKTLTGSGTDDDSDIEIIEPSENSNDSDIEIVETISAKTIVVPDVPFKHYSSNPIICNISACIKKDMNVLIIGDGYGCLIKTIARMYRHEVDNLNIYIVSKFAESLSRNLLFLSLLHTPSSDMGILDKAETLLEVLGNTYLRASTSTFIETKAASILEDIATSTQLLSTIPNVSLKFLKRCEIDEICKILFFLKNPDSTYDIKNAWENSLRAYFGTRYDNRKNLFDYQYSMNLFHYNIISLKKYLQWCETGIAFELRKAMYDCPNKTLCIQNKASDIKSSEFYYGDITTSPYITFGVECEDKTFFKKVNNSYVHTSEDISKFNVIDLMTEFSSKACQEEKKINVHLLIYETFLKKNEFQNFFDAVYVTRDMGAFITRNMANTAESGLLSKVLKKEGIAVFETMRNYVNSSKQLKEMFSSDINCLSKLNDLKSVCTFADGCFKIFKANGIVSENIEN